MGDQQMGRIAGSNIRTIFWQVVMERVAETRIFRYVVISRVLSRVRRLGVYGCVAKSFTRE